MTPAKKRNGLSSVLSGPPQPDASAEARIVRAANYVENVLGAEALAAQVDELGAIEARLAPYKADISRAEALRSALRAAFASNPPDAACEARGARFVAALGPKGIERSVDVAELSRRIGWKAVLPLAKVALNALTRLTDPPLVAAGQASIVSAQTGPRPLQIFAIEPPKVAKKAKGAK